MGPVRRGWRDCVAMLERRAFGTVRGGNAKRMLASKQARTEYCHVCGGALHWSRSVTEYLQGKRHTGRSIIDAGERTHMVTWSPYSSKYEAGTVAESNVHVMQMV